MRGAERIMIQSQAAWSLQRHSAYCSHCTLRWNLSMVWTRSSCTNNWILDELQSYLVVKIWQLGRGPLNQSRSSTWWHLYQLRRKLRAQHRRRGEWYEEKQYVLYIWWQQVTFLLYKTESNGTPILQLSIERYAQCSAVQCARKTAKTFFAKMATKENFELEEALQIHTWT